MEDSFGILINCWRTYHCCIKIKYQQYHYRYFKATIILHYFLTIAKTCKCLQWWSRINQLTKIFDNAFEDLTNWQEISKSCQWCEKLLQLTSSTSDHGSVEWHHMIAHIPMSYSKYHLILVRFIILNLLHLIKIITQYFTYLKTLFKLFLPIPLFTSVHCDQSTSWPKTASTWQDRHWNWLNSPAEINNWPATTCSCALFAAYRNFTYIPYTCRGLLDLSIRVVQLTL